jgi:AraC-like DNA-binding protein
MAAGSGNRTGGPFFGVVTGSWQAACTSISIPYMEYAEWAPGPQLDPFVQCIWTLRQRADGPSVERIVPDARPEIIFNFGDRFRHHLPDGSVAVQPSWFVVGQIPRAMLLESPASSDVLGVRLRPAALPALLALPARELTAQVVDLRRVLRGGDEAWSRAAAAQTMGARVEIVRDFVCRQLRRVARDPDPLVEETLRRVQNSGGALRLKDVARSVGRSPRALERRVLDVVGLTPKTVARIVRIQRILALKQSHPTTTWSALAHRCGYADHAHLTHDFRRMVGVTPTSFFEQPTAMNDAFVQGAPAAFLQDTAPARS